MDISMPGINGIAALKKIKEINKDFSIIMITSYGKNEMIKSALKEGAQGYILKPVSVEKLSESIQKIFPEYLEKKDRVL